MFCMLQRIITNFNDGIYNFSQPKIFFYKITIYFIFSKKFYVVFLMR